MTNLTILYIDDRESTLRAIGVVADLLGCTLLTATTGREGLSKLAEEPDVILLDMELPDMDGIELVQAIRRKHPGVPLIAVTGHIDYRERCLAAGCSDFLVKPFRLPDMADYLRQFARP